MLEPESGWYKQVRTGVVGEWDKNSQTFRPAGSEQEQYVTAKVIRGFSEYVEYEPSLEDLVYDSPTDYKPGDYVIVSYLGNKVYGIIHHTLPSGKYYSVTGFRFREASKSCTRQTVTVANRVGQIRTMEREEKQEFARLLWLCNVHDVRVALEPE